MVCLSYGALYSEEYKDFKQYNGPLEDKDIATLIEVFGVFLQNYSSDEISAVLRNNQGYFLFLLSDGSKGNFDFYDYLNKGYTKENKINCMNAKQLFPQSISIGIYTKQSYDDTGNMDKTGYIDEDELKAQMRNSSNYSLLYLKNNTKLPITKKGFTIGRSTRDANFVVHNNSNVSRVHCTVFMSNGDIYIRDNNSTNGTFVNGKRISSNIDTKIKLDDNIYIADEEFSVV